MPKSSKSFDLHSSTESYSSTAWFKAAGELAPTDPLLNDALIALSLKYAEQNLGSVDAAYQGQLIYSRVVKNLSHRLGNQNEALRDTTLAAIMAMTTWETQAAGQDGATGWLYHVRGALMLVQLRGSKNFATDFGKKLYLGSLLSNVRIFLRLLHNSLTAKSSLLLLGVGEQFRTLGFLPLTPSIPIVLHMPDYSRSCIPYPPFSNNATESTSTRTERLPGRCWSRKARLCHIWSESSNHD